MITIRPKVVEGDKIYLHTKSYENWFVGDGVMAP